MNKNLPTFIWLPVILLAFCGGMLTVFMKEDIKDWWFFRSYEASAEIEQLADEASMSDSGRQLFYRADPELISEDKVEDLCLSDHNLGCLVTGPKIYIVETDNTSLDKRRVQQQSAVTAAHEMLHMAYLRLDDAQKQEVDTLVEQELKEFRNQKIASKVEDYEDQAARLDEAHSYLGSEAETLNTALEQYYTQYFKDRQEVVAAYKRSSSP